MSAGVPLSLMSRSQLERVAIEQQALLKDLISIVRGGTKADWRVRREFDRRLETYGRTLNRELGRQAAAQRESERQRRQVDAHDQLWSSLDGGPNDVPPLLGPDRAPVPERIEGPRRQ